MAELRKEKNKNNFMPLKTMRKLKRIVGWSAMGNILILTATFIIQNSILNFLQETRMTWDNLVVKSWSFLHATFNGM